jgi:hypothetical protein
MTYQAVRPSGELRDAFYELSLSGVIPTAEALEALVKTYPKYASELTQFAIALALDALANKDEEIVEVVAQGTLDPAISRAMSAYQNHLYELKNNKGAQGTARRAEPATIENPFVKLDRVESRKLAQTLNANLTFISKLRDRLIDAGTIPRSFTTMLANALRVPFQTLESHFSAQTPSLVAGQHYKADQKPVLDLKQSYSQAVQSSGLTSEQEQHLMSFKD